MLSSTNQEGKMMRQLEYAENRTVGIAELLDEERHCFEFSEEAALDWLKKYAVSFRKEYAG